MVAAAAVTAAATLLCAKQHDRCAAPDFPSFVQTTGFVQKTFLFYFSSCAWCSRPAGCEPERRAVAVLMARFASHPLSSKIFLHGYIVRLKNATIGATKGQLDLIRGQAKYKMHISSYKEGGPS